MCGINGVFYFKSDDEIDPDVVDRMRQAAVHRGPDDHGTYVRGNVGLGFNRLSIIDQSGGHQPMSNDDETIWIVFNGEIYNFQELRQELIGRGCAFRTRSDTEVILRAWETFGEKVVEKLRGMFAFSIWDARRRILFCARDRLGIKPFYYFLDEGKVFVFASELKSLLEFPDAPREIDTGALEEFMRHRYVIAPRTILRGVAKLPPGHTMTVDSSGARIQKYWDLPMEHYRRSNSDAAILEEFGSLLEETVRQHLISDVPLGAFLSGGVDSSAVVAMMDRCGVSKIKTFSIGYDDPESELPYAQIVADYFKTDHHPLLLTPAKFRDLLPRIVWHMDEPVGDEASLPLYYLSEFARQRVTVAMSGEGSDEIFAGYPIYRTMLGYEWLNRIPLSGAFGRLLRTVTSNRKLRKYASMIGRPLEQRYHGVSRVFEPEEIGRLLKGTNGRGELDPVAAAYQRAAGLSPLDRMCYVDLKTWLADDLLVKADRMSMASSLELRVPFLDHKLVEYVFQLPRSMKLRGRTAKYLLKAYMKQFLPAEILHRSKKGFPVPTKSWFRRDLSEFARETLLERSGPSRLFFEAREIEGLLSAHQDSDLSGPIYSLLVFDQWYRSFVRA